MANIIRIEDLIERRIELPKGLAYDSGCILRRDASVVLDESDRKAINDLMLNTHADDLTFLWHEDAVPDFAKKARVGNYLVYKNPNGIMVLPEFIDGSVIRIDQILPLAWHISGIGVRNNHPCAYRRAGWQCGQFVSEYERPLALGGWKIGDEEELNAYCQDSNIELIEDYAAAKARYDVNGKAIN